MNAPATIVVGGGIAGLYCALRLTKHGDRVTVVDAEPSVGGLTRPWEIGGVTWDRFYHVILESDRQTRSLLAEIGLASQLEFKPVKTAFFTGGRLHPFSTVRDFLVFPELGILDKARLVTTILHARQFGPNEASDRESVVHYLKSWSGENTFDRVWKPLLRAKLGERYPEASAAFIRATIKRLQGTRRQGFREERYGYVRGGYAAILSALEARLRRLGVTFILGSRVRAVMTQGDCVTVATENATFSGDRAVLTLPSPVCAAVTPQLTGPEQRALARDRYLGVVCTSLLVRRALGNAYVTNVAERDFPFTGVINMSALVGREHFNGLDLVYLPKYAAASEAIFAEHDESIITRAVQTLQRIFPSLEAADVQAARVARAPHVFPFPQTGRVQALQPVHTSLEKIAIVNSGRLRYATLNVSDTIGVVDEGLDKLDTDLNWRTPSEAVKRAFAGSR